MPSNAGGIKAGRAFVQIGADTGELAKRLKSAQGQLRAFGDRVSQMGRAFGSVGFAAAAVLTPAITTFADFEVIMARVKAVTGATGADFAKLQKQARNLGATTQFSAREAAEGMVFLGQAGFDTQQIIAGLPAVLDLAKAGAVDLGLAADIASDVSSAFGLAANQISRVADVMSKAANSANVSIENLGEAFKFAAPAGFAAGQSIEEVTASLSSLGNSGLKGGIAGRNLAIVLKSLATEANRVKFDFDVADELGRFRDLSDIFVDLRKQLDGFSEIEKVNFLNDVFGEASKAAQILSNVSLETDRFVTVLQNAEGTANKSAKTMSEGVTGSFKELSSAFESLKITLGQGFGETTNSTLKSLTELVRTSEKWLKTNRQLVTEVATFSGIVGGLGIGLLAVGGIARVASSAIGLLRTAVVGASTATATLIAQQQALTISSTGVGRALDSGVLRMSQFTGATTYGSRALLAFQFASAGLIGVGLGAYLAELWPSMRRFNKELELSIALEKQISDNAKERFENSLRDAQETANLKKRRQELNDLLASEQKELSGLEASAIGAQKNFDRLNSTLKFLKRDKLRLQAKQELEETNARIEETTKQIEQLQEAIKDVDGRIDVEVNVKDAQQQFDNQQADETRQKKDAAQLRADEALDLLFGNADPEELARAAGEAVKALQESGESLRANTFRQIAESAAGQLDNLRQLEDEAIRVAEGAVAGLRDAIERGQLEDARRFVDAGTAQAQAAGNEIAAEFFRRFSERVDAIEKQRRDDAERLKEIERQPLNQAERRLEEARAVGDDSLIEKALSNVIRQAARVGDTDRAADALRQLQLNALSNLGRDATEQDKVIGTSNAQIASLLLGGNRSAEKEDTQLLKEMRKLLKEISQKVGNIGFNVVP